MVKSMSLTPRLEMVSSVWPPRCPRACNTKPEIRKPTSGGSPNCCASNPKKNATAMRKTSITFLGNLDARVSDKRSLWPESNFRTPSAHRIAEVQTEDEKSRVDGAPEMIVFSRATETRLPRELGMRLPAARHVLLCNRPSLSTTRCPPGAPAAQCSWPAGRPDDASAVHYDPLDRGYRCDSRAARAIPACERQAQQKQSTVWSVWLGYVAFHRR